MLATQVGKLWVISENSCHVLMYNDYRDYNSFSTPMYVSGLLLSNIFSPGYRYCKEIELVFIVIRTQDS